MKLQITYSWRKDSMPSSENSGLHLIQIHTMKKVTSSLDGRDCYTSPLDSFVPRETAPDSHWTGVWVSSSG
jgi:hypothetical protein